MTIAVRISACGRALAAPATDFSPSRHQRRLAEGQSAGAKISRLAAFEIIVRPKM